MTKVTTPESPIREYRTIIRHSGDPGYVNRLLIATPTRGTVRIEWVAARYGQIIPVNWSQVQMIEFMNSYIPLEYPVADAQNMIVKEVVEKDFEWLLLVEDDVLPPPDGFIRINEYVRSAKVPVVSGLYYTKSYPAEPLVFRGRGTGAFVDFKLGERVWCDGVPTGFLLIHSAILRAMWAESPEYAYKGVITRRVFDTPRLNWQDPETGQWNSQQGTSDLKWCTRVMEGGYFEKSGWGKFQGKRWPFLVDTKLFCRHIDTSGIQYP